eukprot:Colp12_sorted_trinity150504_noHs@5826
MKRQEVQDSMAIDHPVKDQGKAKAAFLAGLPSYNKDNFSHVLAAPGSKATTGKRPVVYTPTHSRTSPPPHQVITTDKTNILLRYLYQQFENTGTSSRGKRTHAEAADVDDSMTPLKAQRTSLRDRR